jgi:hypothetical protein
MKAKLYIMNSVMVWVAIIASISILTRNTPYFGKLLTLLGGATWFIVITPATFKLK